MAERRSVVVLLVVSAAALAAADIQQQAQELAGKAQAAFSKGDLNDAAKQFKKLDDLIGKVTPMALNNLAVVYTQQHKVSKADKTYKKAMKRFPKDAETFLSYCRFGAGLMQMKLTEKIESSSLLKSCRKAVDLAPKNLEALIVLGSVYTLQMDFASSWPILEKAVKIGKKKKDQVHLYEQALTNLALANLRGARPEEALRWSKELAKLPKTEKIYDVISNIRSIALRYDKDAVKYSHLAKEAFANGFKQKGPNCKSGKWSLVSNYTSLAQEKGVSVDLVNEDSAYQPYGELNAPNFAKGVLEPYYNTYHEHFVHLIKFKGKAFLWAPSGIVHIECKLLKTYSMMFPTQEVPTWMEEGLARVKNIDDPVVSTLPMYNSGNYYHWICEGFVRLLWMKELILDKAGGDKYQILVPGPGTRFIEDSLKLLDIPKKRVIYYPKTAEPNVVWKFQKEFVMLDWQAPREDTYGSLNEDVWSPVYQPREALHRVRSFFHDQLSKRNKLAPNTKGKIVYVSRKNAVRMIFNEDEVIEALKEEFGHDNVQTHKGTEPLLDQAAMFANAEIVVGAHGAGLTNLVHCREESSFVLFPMRPHADHTYSHMASALNLHTWIVTEVSSYYYNNYGTVSDAEVKLIVDTVRRAMGKSKSHTKSEL
eukprot:m.130221 g.130221  ORF g.130221 m.130221 type:complete len:650 (-) comp14599_c0_seq6:43-1992(-)